jgi:NADH-quinone oxidoreductase subunit J
MMDSPLAAVFELSICAGLITVIIMTTINFVKPLTHEDLLKTRKRRFKRYIGLPIILVLIGLTVPIMIKPITLKLPEIIKETNVLNVLWNFRQTDLLGQAILILIGVFGILVLFREGQKK